jgi:hypothetical protein
MFHLHRGGPFSIAGQLTWTKRHWDKFMPKYGNFLQSVSLILRSMLINLPTIDPRNILKYICMYVGVPAATASGCTAACRLGVHP